LLSHFLVSKAEDLKLEPPTLTQGAIDTLAAYNWPRNVGELASFVERLVGLHPGEEIAPNHPLISSLVSASPEDRSTDPSQVWRLITEGSISERLPALAKQYGIPVAIDVARHAVRESAGRFPREEECQRLFGGMTNNAFRVWLKQNGYTLKDLK